MFRKGTAHTISMYYCKSATTQLDNPVFKKSRLLKQQKQEKHQTPKNETNKLFMYYG